MKVRAGAVTYLTLLMSLRIFTCTISSRTIIRTYVRSYNTAAIKYHSVKFLTGKVAKISHVAQQQVTITKSMPMLLISGCQTRITATCNKTHFPGTNI